MSRLVVSMWFSLEIGGRQLTLWFQVLELAVEEAEVFLCEDDLWPGVRVGAIAGVAGLDAGLHGPELGRESPWHCAVS